MKGPSPRRPHPGDPQNSGGSLLCQGVEGATEGPLDQLNKTHKKSFPLFRRVAGVCVLHVAKYRYGDCRSINPQGPICTHDHAVRVR